VLIDRKADVNTKTSNGTLSAELGGSWRLIFSGIVGRLVWSAISAISPASRSGGRTARGVMLIRPEKFGDRGAGFFDHNGKVIDG